ncbi:hypothetical protein J3R83DRAFT_6931 [Lanmaoa asiatica]|nr:hypothetical protein J3R83DRAFT_6931 [Lanmaoa asiatica]
MSSRDPSGGRFPPDFHPQEHEIVGSVQTSIHSLPSHPTPGYERLPDSDGSPQLVIPPSPAPSPSLSSPMNHLGEMGDINQNHGLAMQRRGILLGLESSVGEITPRKRKRTHDSPRLDHTHQDNDAFTDSANPRSSRRIRPRLRIPQDREFSPLLFIASGEERDPLVEEGTMGVFHHPPNMTNPPHAIQRRPGNLPERDPCNSSPEVNDLRDHKGRRRSGSTSSFAQVALASTVTPKHGRLSTLQDFWLPRPFEEASVGIIKVHERGLDAGPSFLSTNSGDRAGGPRASREPAGLLTDTTPGHDIQSPIREHDTHACSSRSVNMLPLEPSSTNFFDKPICDSPDPIDPTDEDGLTHFELPATQADSRSFSSRVPDGRTAVRFDENLWCLHMVRTTVF